MGEVSHTCLPCIVYVFCKIYMCKFSIYKHCKSLYMQYVCDHILYICIVFLCCISLDPLPVGVQCPLTSSLGEFPFYWISFVFLLYDRCICTHMVDPSLTHLLSEFPGLGLALVPTVVVPAAEQGAHEAEISFRFKFLPWPGLNLGPCSLMAANATTTILHTLLYICSIYNIYTHIQNVDIVNRNKAFNVLNCSK